MKTDPAPRRQDPDALEARFDALFAAVGTLPVLDRDPSRPRTGQVWLTQDGRLRACLNGGRIVTLAQTV